MAAALLTAGGVTVPDAVGVIDKTGRIFPGLTRVSGPDALRDLVHAQSGGDIFGKIVDGMVSFSAFTVLAADEAHITCAGHAPMTYDRFMAEFVEDNSYLLQRKLQNHAEVADYCSAVATVRMVNPPRDNDVYCPMAVI